MNNDFPFLKPLPSELIKKCDEYFAYLVLKLCEPERYAELFTADAPDLQMPDKSIGIEVTVAVSQDNAQITGEFTKYAHGKQNPKDRAECERKIIKCGGRIDQVEVKGSETISNLTYPVTDSKKELIDYKRDSGVKSHFLKNEVLKT